MLPVCGHASPLSLVSIDIMATCIDYLECDNLYYEKQHWDAKASMTKKNPRIHRLTISLIENRAGVVCVGSGHR